MFPTCFSTARLRGLCLLCSVVCLLSPFTLHILGITLTVESSGLATHSQYTLASCLWEQVSNKEILSTGGERAGQAGAGEDSLSSTSRPCSAWGHVLAGSAEPMLPTSHPWFLSPQLLSPPLKFPTLSLNRFPSVA